MASFDVNVSQNHADSSDSEDAEEGIKERINEQLGNLLDDDFFNDSFDSTAVDSKQSFHRALYVNACHMPPQPYDSHIEFNAKQKENTNFLLDQNTATYSGFNQDTPNQEYLIDKPILNEEKMPYPQQQPNKMDYFVKYRPQNETYSQEINTNDETIVNNKMEQQFSQLKILYEARGRQLEDFSAAFEEKEREIRILKHEVAMATEQAESCKNGREQMQVLLIEEKDKVAKLESENSNLDKQLANITNCKEDAERRLAASEATVDVLQRQVCQLEASDAVARTRYTHEAYVDSLKQRHSSQIANLEQKYDEAENQRRCLEDEINSVKKKLNEATKEAESARIERADTVNRLTESLKRSQEQCEQLLAAGTGQEIGKANAQLKEALAGKTIAQDMNKALQAELNDVKEQLILLENFTQLSDQVNSKNSDHCNPDDSYAQLGIKQKQETAVDDLVHRLKSELERCLNNYRNKRQQVLQLQDQLAASKLKNNELEESLKEMKNYKNQVEIWQDKYGDLESHRDVTPLEAKLKRDLERLRGERDLLKEEFTELEIRLNEAVKSEESLNELNKQLSSEMSAMAAEFDSDKREAIMRTQSECLRLQEETREKLKNELEMKHDEEKHKLENQLSHTVNTLNDQIKSLEKELSEVKEDYVKICESKDIVEDSLRLRLEDERNRAIKDAVEEAEKTLKESFERQLTERSESIREQLNRENSIRQKNELQNELSKTKAEWERLKAGQFKVALDDARLEWNKQFEEKLQEKQAQLDKSISTQQKLELSLSEMKQNSISRNVHMVELKSLRQKFDTNIQQLRNEKQQENLKNDAQVEMLKTAHEKKIKEMLDERRKAIEEIRKEFSGNITRLEKNIKELKNEKNSLMKEIESLKSDLQAKDKEVKASVKKIKDELKMKHENDIDEVIKGMENSSSSAEVVRLKKELENAADKIRDLEKAKENSAEERRKLIKLKDEERRRDVEEIEKKCEADFNKFFDEHQGTLSHALKTQRVQFEKEMSQLAERQSEEMKLYRERIRNEIKEELGTDKRLIAAEHAEEVEELKRQMREDIETLSSEHSKKIKQVEDDWLSRCSFSTRTLHQKLSEAQRTISEHEMQIEAYEQQMSNVQQEIDQRHREIETEVRNKIEKMKLAKFEAVRKVEAEITKFKEEINQITSEKKNLIEKNTRIIQEKLEIENSLRKMKENQIQSEEQIKDLKDVINTLRKKPPIDNKCTQTEKAEQTYDKVQEIRMKYMKSVEKIKDEFLQHDEKVSKENADRIRMETTRIKNATIRKMKHHCLRIVSNLLQRFDATINKEEFLKWLNEALTRNPPESIASSITTLNSRSSSPGSNYVNLSCLPYGPAPPSRPTSAGSMPVKSGDSKSGVRRSISSGAIIEKFTLALEKTNSPRSETNSISSGSFTLPKPLYFRKIDLDSPSSSTCSIASVGQAPTPPSSAPTIPPRRSAVAGFGSIENLGKRTIVQTNVKYGGSSNSPTSRSKSYGTLDRKPLKDFNSHRGTVRFSPSSTYEPGEAL
ncbi:DgyrCDS1427 [Dimorphilus gyrociliatus]|uniref:DgyrCDS1427 n=1 Tax=Dimorphilus gyrociliatus TaxID=2664684 RepID=A0A7I8V8S9_9ANNE|nr:DgyrCDS1427 [Dimorphilus gyrociliatus]